MELRSTVWRCMGQKCKKGVCGWCSQMQDVDGVSKLVYACKNTKCNECYCGSGDSDSGVDDESMDVEVSILPNVAHAAAGHVRTRVSKRQRTSTIGEDFVTDFDGIDNPKNHLLADPHIVLGSTKGNISDLSAAFGSLSVDAAISKISNKWKKERQTNPYTAGVDDELGHLKKVLNSCMENLSAHLLPSAPGMIMEAVKAQRRRC